MDNSSGKTSGVKIAFEAQFADQSDRNKQRICVQEETDSNVCYSSVVSCMQWKMIVKPIKRIFSIHAKYQNQLINDNWEEKNYVIMQETTFNKKQHQQINANSKSNSNSNSIPSFLILFAAAILINLCPFESNNEPRQVAKRIRIDANNETFSPIEIGLISSGNEKLRDNNVELKYIMSKCIMFSEAKMLIKMAKMIYIKKKIKKLNKKLKKHTIAVPVITAIPIYEHSYYPPAHVTHLSHHGHAGSGPAGYSNAYHGAASYYSPTYAQAPSSGRASDISSGYVDSISAASSSLANNASYGENNSYQQQQQQQQHYQQEQAAAAAATAYANRNAEHLAATYANNARYNPYYLQQQQQLHTATYPLTTTSAYNQHHNNYMLPSNSHSTHYNNPHPYSTQNHPHYATPSSASTAAQQIINAYAPSPPVFYGDESGGMFGHYGNAYGRYDGGYHMW